MTDEPLSDAEPQPFIERLRRQLRGLYFGRDREAIRFQVAMLLLDIAILVFFVTGPYQGKECQIRSIVAATDAREIEFTLEHGVAT